MKIEQLLVQHFYNCREVTLQGMGTFSLSPDFVMPKENDKDADIPDNAISFTYNARATEDDALISFIVEQTRKMKSLAAADLDSYLALGKQFLHIGKPFKIEGIGMLVKNQQGQLEFTKGMGFLSKLETGPAALKEKTETAEISFASEARPSSRNSKKGILAAAIIISIGLLGIVAWYFLFRDNDKLSSPVAVAATTDTLQAVVPKKDTVALPVPLKPAPANDGYTFKVVFLVTTDSGAAASRMNTLIARKHQVIMYKQDSTRYRLAEPFTVPLTDTARIKDSLNRYYYSGKGFIEL